MSFSVGYFFNPLHQRKFDCMPLIIISTYTYKYLSNSIVTDYILHNDIMKYNEYLSKAN